MTWMPLACACSSWLVRAVPSIEAMIRSLAYWRSTLSPRASSCVLTLLPSAIQRSDDLVGIATPTRAPAAAGAAAEPDVLGSVSYTHLRAHETKANLVCRLLLE